MGGGGTPVMAEDRHGSLQDWQQNAGETRDKNNASRDMATALRFHNAATTIRPVTPEAEPSSAGLSTSDEDSNAAPSTTQISPRSTIPKDRRQGFIFRPEPPESDRPETTASSRRSRTRTTEEAATNYRHRLGSLHANTQTFREPAERSSSVASAPGMQYPCPPNLKTSATLQKSISPTKKHHPGKRLMKRSSSRPSSSRTLSPRPSVDCLRFPVSTDDPGKILALMGSLNGYMKGQVEYQLSRAQSWASGICYIDGAKGCLVCEELDHGPFHQTLISDLRGCRTRPIVVKPQKLKALEISFLGLELIIIPSSSTDYDGWLAALLYWQQTRPMMSPSNLKSPEPLFGEIESPRARKNSTASQGSIIKVGNILLWDDGLPLSPSPLVRQSAPRDDDGQSWHRVSCTLQDDGEFKLMTENDNTFLAVVHLRHLSRCAIQPLEKSVLDEQFCIAIFPQYSSSSSVLTIIRPIYIALDSRVLFEVWFVLLRAFCAPEVYGPHQDMAALSGRLHGRPPEFIESLEDMFRIEKSLRVRVVEAKIRKRRSNTLPEESRRSQKLEVDPTIGDYFVEVMLDGEIRARTVTKTQTRNPFWREECEFLDLPSSLNSISIVLKKLERPEPGANQEQFYEKYCGYVDIPLEKLDKNVENERWWPLLDDDNENVGEVFLKIRLEELVVLMSRDYQPVLELLDRFNNGLTVQIAQSIPLQLKRLAELFVNIFQVSGNCLEWLTGMIEEEIDGIAKESSLATSRMRFNHRVASNDSLDATGERELIVRDMGKSLTGEANLLFRGNTLLTQALDFHMRRVGKEYLKSVLSERINEIESANLDCEVDPSRMGSSEDLERNWDQLRALTTSVWSAIRNSVANCPSEIRILLKHVRSCADSRYGDFLRNVQYTAVSGFLFLRFFCPAVLNPKLFGLLKDHPRPKAQRTFTLIAKSLQVLANLSNFGQKESWMEPMNRFLTGHRQGVKDFIDDLCSLPAERGTNFAVPASYSTPITILARLPQLSKEGFPSLPYLIDHPKNFAALIKLWLDSTSPDANGLEGDLLKFHNLCVAIQQRTDECLNKAAEYNEAYEPLFQWDYMPGISGPAFSDRMFLQTPSPPSSPTSTYSQSQPREPRSSTALSQFISSSSLNGLSLTSNIKAPDSSGSDTASGREREKRDRSRDKDRYRDREKHIKERQGFWESTFGKDGKLHKPYEVHEALASGSGAVSPPSRGPSRNGKPRSFLSGLRRKGRLDSHSPVSPPQTGVPMEVREEVEVDENGNLRERDGQGEKIFSTQWTGGMF